MCSETTLGELILAQVRGVRAHAEAVPTRHKDGFRRSVAGSFRGDDSTNSPTRWITCHGRPPSYNSPWHAGVGQASASPRN